MTKAPSARRHPPACSATAPQAPLFHRLWREDQAAQLLEFAVALPLLMIFVVGIFDFSGAYTLKEKLTNIARDAARAAAADPASDLTNNVPASIADAYQIISNYLAANQINNCAMTPPAGTSSTLTWTITANGNGCPSPGLTIIINRGFYFPAGINATQPPGANCQQSQSAGSQTSIIATCVSIQYAYQWQFGRVSGLLGSNAVLPPSLTAISVAINEN